jgi:putative radical SAM enzyme (TIGR03279 family)
MRHTITSVGGIAQELGIEAGDTLLSINDHPIKDAIDYEYFCAQTHFTMLFETKDGSLLEAEIEKAPDEHMGLAFANSLMSKQRSCINHCIFCFIDQLPDDARDTMRFKDDDWRLSFIMGNYVTLTNVNEQELTRIIERRVSPLYISVHTTNPSLRAFMLGREDAPIMPQLQKLALGGITFHTQAVLCPGINDGQELKKTFDDLFALFPNTLSLAVVPVGLTGHRQGLHPLNAYSTQEAGQVIDFVEHKQKLCLAEKGTRFIYASDEFYLLARRTIPPYETYESFCQIENGVGLLAKFERELDEALPELSPCKRQIYILTGQASQTFM